MSRPVRLSIAAASFVGIVGGLTWAVWPNHKEAARMAPLARDWGIGQPLPVHKVATAAVPITPSGAPETATHTVATTTIATPPPPPPTMGFWEATNVTVRESTAPEKKPKPDPDVATPGSAPSDYAQRMRTTNFSDVTPTPVLFHRHYTIRKGTTFACTPSQPISSSLPGPVRCTTDEPVYSIDGTTILLPKGTQVNGSVERGLTTGEERLFLVWTDALTPRPDLLPIPLDSPAADELGQTGASGDVDEHLWKKLKAALLLSAVQFVGSAATAAIQNSRNSIDINTGQISNTGNSLAQIALEHDINIPPTLYRGPGQPLTVYISHYIDLVNFYRDTVSTDTPTSLLRRR